MAGLGVVRHGPRDPDDHADRRPRRVARAAGSDAHTMSDVIRAVVIDAYAEAPVVRDWPRPTAGPGQSLIGLEAAGLNPVDLAISSGRFYLPLPEPPCVAGVE